MANPKIHLVVAACRNRGIGMDGKIPWRLKKDMEFFKRITSETENESKENVVIMGRKTWMSIPPKFRPLKNRVNIILSNTMTEPPDGAYLANSFSEAMKLSTTGPMKDRIESIHVIGGSSVYQEALNSNYDCRIFLTKVDADFECDTFLPEFEEKATALVDNPANVPSEIQTENGINFSFVVYDKICS
ncbi:dihydrofolate reductase [Patella vulgata]|uniref:dihydrofolate reductase n=1 Tax=Patella vulgata TaxID=6465 RepID=UPI0021804D27|nr:dihydrofolate reductase [Patella vulgata]